MAAFPNSLQDIAGLADWLELLALEAADGDASAGDLERELNKQNIGNADDVLVEVFDELHRREKAAGTAYPYESSGTLLTLRNSFSSEPAPYFFCLLLSFAKWKAKKGAKTNPWLLFEELSCLAARNYVGGEAILFGTSSRKAKQKGRFEKQVNELARALGEGEGYKSLPGVRVQDGKVDVIAWKPFPDQRGSQWILFGQCAAGGDWNGSKLSALIPNEGFWANWMLDQPISPLTRSYFIPHRVAEDGYWKLYARQGGVLFDRCRIALYSVGAVTAESTDVFKFLRESCKEHWQCDVPVI